MSMSASAVAAAACARRAVPVRVDVRARLRTEDARAILLLRRALSSSASSASSPSSSSASPASTTTLHPMVRRLFACRSPDDCLAVLDAVSNTLEDAVGAPPPSPPLASASSRSSSSTQPRSATQPPLQLDEADLYAIFEHVRQLMCTPPRPLSDAAPTTSTTTTNNNNINNVNVNTIDDSSVDSYSSPDALPLASDESPHPMVLVYAPAILGALTTIAAHAARTLRTPQPVWFEHVFATLYAFQDVTHAMHLYDTFQRAHPRLALTEPTYVCLVALAVQHKQYRAVFPLYRTMRKLRLAATAAGAAAATTTGRHHLPCENLLIIDLTLTSCMRLGHTVHAAQVVDDLLAWEARYAEASTTETSPTTTTTTMTPPARPIRTLSTYYFLVSYYSAIEQHAALHPLLSQLLQSPHIRLTTPFCALLIDVFARAGMWDAIQRLVYVMNEQGVQLYPGTYASLIRALERRCAMESSVAATHTDADSSDAAATTTTTTLSTMTSLEVRHMLLSVIDQAVHFCTSSGLVYTTLSPPLRLALLFHADATSTASSPLSVDQLSRVVVVRQVTATARWQLESILYIAMTHVKRLNDGLSPADVDRAHMLVVQCSSDEQRHAAKMFIKRAYDLTATVVAAASSDKRAASHVLFVSPMRLIKWAMHGAPFEHTALAQTFTAGVVASNVASPSSSTVASPSPVDKAPSRVRKAASVPVQGPRTTDAATLPVGSNNAKPVIAHAAPNVDKTEPVALTPTPIDAPSPLPSAQTSSSHLAQTPPSATLSTSPDTLSHPAIEPDSPESMVSAEQPPVVDDSSVVQLPSAPTSSPAVVAVEPAPTAVSDVRSDEARVGDQHAAPPSDKVDVDSHVVSPAVHVDRVEHVAQPEPLPSDSVETLAGAPRVEASTSTPADVAAASLAEASAEPPAEPPAEVPTEPSLDASLDAPADVAPQLISHDASTAPEAHSLLGDSVPAPPRFFVSALSDIVLMCQFSLEDDLQRVAHTYSVERDRFVAASTTSGGGGAAAVVATSLSLHTPLSKRARAELVAHTAMLLCAMPIGSARLHLVGRPSDAVNASPNESDGSDTLERSPTLRYSLDAAKQMLESSGLYSEASSSATSSPIATLTLPPDLRVHHMRSLLFIVFLFLLRRSSHVAPSSSSSPPLLPLLRIECAQAHASLRVVAQFVADAFGFVPEFEFDSLVSSPPSSPSSPSARLVVRPSQWQAWIERGAPYHTVAWYRDELDVLGRIDSAYARAAAREMDAQMRALASTPPGSSIRALLLATGDPHVPSLWQRSVLPEWLARRSPSFVDAIAARWTTMPAAQRRSWLLVLLGGSTVVVILLAGFDLGRYVAEHVSQQQQHGQQQQLQRDVEREREREASRTGR